MGKSKLLFYLAVLGLLVVFGVSCGSGDKEPEKTAEQPTTTTAPTESKPATTEQPSKPAAPTETAPAAPQQSAAVSNGGGTIVGEVKFAGDPPEPEKMEINKDQEVCGTEKTVQAVQVGDSKGIANVVVYIKDNIQNGTKMEAVSPELDQQNCEYQPKVLIFPVGTELAILNSDGITHNVHTYSTENPIFNQAQPKFKKKITHTFEKPEIIDVKCDIHGWMHATLVVQAHPYYVKTDENGSFKLTGVPPGTYTLAFWGNNLGPVEQQVEVQEGQESNVSAEMTLK